MNKKAVINSVLLGIAIFLVLVVAYRIGFKNGYEECRLQSIISTANNASTDKTFGVSNDAPEEEQIVETQHSHTPKNDGPERSSIRNIKNNAAIVIPEEEIASYDDLKGMNESHYDEDGYIKEEFRGTEFGELAVWSGGKFRPQEE